MHWKHLFLSLLLAGLLLSPSARAQKDSERLGMAIEYFQSGKYHEALLLFLQLEKQYQLNPRFLAYMGVCYFQDWDYKNAAKYLDAHLEQLAAFAPHERAVYYYSAAESHFLLEEYGPAIPLYEQMLNVCYDNEKADAMFRLGFCYLFTDNKPTAADYFTSALAYYRQYPKPGNQAREEQLRKMLKGLAPASVPPNPPQ